MDAGILPTDDCISEFNEMRMKKKYQYIIYKIVDKK